MTVAALLLEVAYFLFAVVGRSWLQWRRTGDAGLRIGRDASSAARVASGLLVAGTAVDFVVPLLVLNGLRVVALPIAVRVGGLGLLAAGVAGTVVAQLAMGASWRIGVGEHERTELVTDGPFARVRNPIFTNMICAAIGLALALPHASSSVAGVLVIAGIELQVRAVEEPYLLRVHGDAYRAYTARAGRFWPGVGRSVTSRS